MNEKWQNVEHLQQQVIFWRWWVIAFQDAALRDFEAFSKMESRVAKLERLELWRLAHAEDVTS